MNRIVSTLVALAAFFAYAAVTSSTAFAENPFKGCVSESATDGRYGFVWKPSGAHRSAAVLVLPNRYVLQTTSVQLYTPAPKRKLIETLSLKSTGVCVPGLECLMRPTFAAIRNGASYQAKYGKIVIRVITKSNHCFLYSIRRPDLRSD